MRTRKTVALLLCFAMLFSMFAATVTVNAADTVTIYFDPGEGSGTMEPITVASGSSTTLPDCAFTPPEGMEFVCWGDPVWDNLYKNNEKVYYQTEDITLTAYWVPFHTLTVTGKDADTVEAYYYYSPDGYNYAKIMTRPVHADGLRYPDGAMLRFPWLPENCTVTPDYSLTFEDASWNIFDACCDYTISIPIDYNANYEFGSGIYVNSSTDFPCVGETYYIDLEPCDTYLIDTEKIRVYYYTYTDDGTEVINYVDFSLSPVNGDFETYGGRLSFIAPEADVIVKVPTFLMDLNVNVTDTEHGALIASDEISHKGSTVTVTPDPDDGYALYSLTVTNADGEKVTANRQSDGTYNFVMPSSDVTISGEFRRIYTYTVNDNPDGVVSIDSGSAFAGTIISFVVQFPSNSNTNEFSIKTESGASVHYTQSSTLTSKRFFFTMPEENVTITAVAYYALSKTTPSKGTLSVASSAAAGERVVITAAPALGYKLDTLTVKRVDNSQTITTRSLGNNEYRFTMTACPVSVSATFVKRGTAHYAPGDPIIGYDAHSGQNGTFNGGTDTSESYQYLVDGDMETKWCTVTNRSTYQTNYIEFGTPKSVRPSAYVLVTGNDTYNNGNRLPKSWTLKGRKSLADKWTVLDTVTNDTTLQAVNGIPFTFKLSNVAGEFHYFRFEITEIRGKQKNGDWTMELAEIYFLGLEKPITFTHHSAVPATCTQSGTYGYYTGSDGGYYGEADSATEITQADTIQPALGHDWGEYTVTRAATCYADGVETSYCSRCSATKTRSISSSTAHTLVHHDEVPVTDCTVGGVIEYWACSICGKAFSDSNASGELEEGEWIIQPSSHVPGNAQIENEVEPTCTEEGCLEAVTYCQVCGKELERIPTALDALGHNFVDGVCERCGKNERGTITLVSEHGTAAVTVNGDALTSAVFGDTIEVTAVEEEWYNLESVQYTPAGGTTVSAEYINGKYTFVMPDCDVTVTLLYTPDEWWYALDDDGNATITKYTGDATAEMPSEIDSHPVVGFTKSTFADFKTTLVTLSIPSTVKVIPNESLKNMTALKNVYFSEGLERIESYAFADCASLENVVFPSTLTYIGRIAFEGCDAFTEITVPSGITIIEDSAFLACKNLVKVTLLGDVTLIGSEAFRKCESLTTINLPSTLSGIGNEAFEECCNLDNVDLPDGLLTLGYQAFLGCTSLEEIAIPGTVEYVSRSAFKGCTSLSAVTFENGTKKINSSAFNGCTSLEGIELPESLEYIDTCAFEGCTSLSSAEFDSKIYFIGEYAFSDCSSLETVDLEGTDVKNIGKGAFKGCSLLENIFFSLKLETIGDYALSGTAVESVSVPDSTTSIGKAFYECESINTVFLNSGITELKSNAFYGCTNLEIVNLPEELEVIEDSAFYGCDMLSIVNYGGSILQWNDITIGSIGNTALDNASVICGKLVVIFNANGGEGTMDPFVIGISDVVNLPANAFTKEGYRFVGWLDDTDAIAFSDNQRIEGQSLLNQPNIINLRASWIKTHTVTIAVTDHDAGMAYSSNHEDATEFLAAEDELIIIDYSFDAEKYENPTFSIKCTEDGNEVDFTVEYDLYSDNAFMSLAFYVPEYDVSVTFNADKKTTHRAGDTNADGVINAHDVSYIKLVLVGAFSTDPKIYDTCDIDGDGAITAHDLAALKLILVS